MAEMRINECSRLMFVDPAVVLPQLRQIQFAVSASSLNARVRNLRTANLRSHREGWEAALFCCGIGKFLGVKVYVAPYAASDYDAVAMWVKGETQHFTPLQIKELVPEELNPDTDINKEIAKLGKY